MQDWKACSTRFLFLRFTRREAPLFHGGFGWAETFGALRLLRAGLRAERRAPPDLS